MICKHCGKDNKDEASFCISCGEKLDSAEETKEEKETSSGSSVFSKKILIIASIGVAAVLILILTIALILRNPAERALKQMYSAALSYDYEDVVGALPPVVVDDLKAKLALHESELEIADSKELLPVHVAEIDEVYRRTYDTEEGYIQDAAIVYIEAKWKGEVLTRDRISVYMVKIGGEWYLDPLTTFGDFTMDGLVTEFLD